jgi:hypothetical protein
MNQLQKEWREAYECGIVARSFYATLAASPAPDAHLLDVARDRLDRINALKARIAAQMESLEDKMLSGIVPWRAAGQR